MLFIMNDQRFNVATEKANIVLEKLSLKKGEVVDTTRLVQVVEELTSTEIIVGKTDFNKIDNNCLYGAMMCVTEKNGKRTALIVLNSNDKIDAKVMRFSLVHELGHLLTEKYNIADNNNQFTLSTHINYKFSSIKKEDYDSDNFLLNEEIANVFALKVLLPADSVFAMLSEFDSHKKTADYFGVPEEALRSRLELGT